MKDFWDLSPEEFMPGRPILCQMHIQMISTGGPGTIWEQSLQELIERPTQLYLSRQIRVIAHEVHENWAEDDPELYVALAEATRSLEYYEKAIKALGRLFPNTNLSCAYFSTCHSRLGQIFLHADAKATAFRLMPREDWFTAKYFEDHYAICRALLIAQQNNITELCEIAAEAAVKFAASDVNGKEQRLYVYERLGTFYAMVGDYSMALNVAKMILKTFPDSRDATERVYATVVGRLLEKGELVRANDIAGEIIGAAQRISVDLEIEYHDQKKRGMVFLSPQTDHWSRNLFTRLDLKDQVQILTRTAGLCCCPLFFERAKEGIRQIEQVNDCTSAKIYLVSQARECLEKIK